MKVIPAWRVYILGATLCVALTICSRHFGDRGGASFLIPLGVAGIAYLLAIREFFSTPQIPRHVIVIGLALAALWHVAFLMTPPVADDDIHRYLWDGRVQRLGYNPYVVIPNDPALSGLHTPETRTLNNAYLSSPYPPGAQVFFRSVTTIHESVFSLKVAFVLCDFAIVLVLLDILRRSGQGVHWVLAYAWNPLLAMVKLVPIVLLPLYWRRVRLRDATLAAVAVGLLYVPFLNHGRISIGSLGTYVHSFRFNDPVFATLERVAGPQLVAGLAVLVGFLTAIWMRSKDQALSPDAFAWPMAASLLCAPVVYPWYLLWMLPFVRSASTVPIILWTVSIIPTYYVWHLRTLGRPWIVPGWIMLLEYGAVAVATAIIGLRRHARPSVPECSTDLVSIAKAGCIPSAVPWVLMRFPITFHLPWRSLRPFLRALRSKALNRKVR